MIFVTVGTQLPFNRMIDAIEGWDKVNEVKIMGQIGEGDKPTCFPTKDFLESNEYIEFIRGSDLIVSHAGTGTILTAQQFEKPLILFPRLFEKNEHRNNHQITTCKYFEDKPGIKVAWNEEELVSLLDGFLSGDLKFQKSLPPENKLSKCVAAYIRNELKHG